MNGYQELAFWRAHVTPAPGCPHYITTREADSGAITCGGCSTRPIKASVKQHRGRPRARTRYQSGGA